jgi:hypothetical protein
MRLNLEKYTEESIEAGGPVPPGWYRCIVDDVYPDSKNRVNTIVKFKILEGTHKDCCIFDRVMDPEQAPDTEKAEFANKRLGLYCSRLGILQKSEFGKETDVDLADGIGTDCWVHNKERRYQDKETGEWKTAVGVDYGGVYPLGHAKLPVELGGQAGAKKAASAAKAAGATTAAPSRRSAASTQQDFSDLV